MASMTYFVEKPRWTFVDSFWYSLMTLTTVGYDRQPASIVGKLLGGFCALLGVFILTVRRESLDPHLCLWWSQYCDFFSFPSPS